MIIAVDFDGILTTSTRDFPQIGPPNYKMVSFIRELMDRGHEVVLWTSRTDNALADAIEWCLDRGLKFCAINHNAPSNVAKYKDVYPNGTRKVHANIYIDDHDPHFMSDVLNCGYSKAYDNLIDAIRKVEKAWIISKSKEED